MGSKIIVNFLTTQHKVSNGTTACFPDVCKTPAPPAPFAPIPYPNIGQSTMASSKVTMRVTDDKQKVVVKDSEYATSSGDEAGTLLGVASNKIKGTSKIMNTSFDTKFESKGVGRLTDPHGNNSGEPANGPCPAQVQPPSLAKPGMGAEQAEACKRLDKKRVKEEDRPDVAHKYGMQATHAEDISGACMETGMSATARGTNPSCMEKIRDGFATKPAGAAGKSITDPGSLPSECKGLVGMQEELADGTKRFTGINTTTGPISEDALHQARAQCKDSAEFTEWMKNKGAMTGDYDMHDVFDASGQRAPYNSAAESDFMTAANDAIGRTDPDTRMVQHGPQANVKEYFDANPEKAAEDLEAFGEKKFNEIQQPDLRKKPPEPLLHFDSNGEMYEIETEDELKDLYACKGAEYPEHWKNPPKPASAE